MYTSLQARGTLPSAVLVKKQIILSERLQFGVCEAGVPCR